MVALRFFMFFIFIFFQASALNIILEDNKIIKLSAEQKKMLADYSKTIEDALSDKVENVTLTEIQEDVFLFLIETILPLLNDEKKTKKAINEVITQKTESFKNNFLTLINFLDIESIKKIIPGTKAHQSLNGIIIQWPTEEKKQTLYKKIFNDSQTLKNYITDQQIDLNTIKELAINGLNKTEWNLLVTLYEQLEEKTKPSLNEYSTLLTSSMKIEQLVILARVTDFLEMPFLMSTVSKALALQLNENKTLNKLYSKQNQLEKIISGLTPATINEVRSFLLDLQGKRRTPPDTQINTARISKNSNNIAGLTFKDFKLWNTKDLNNQPSIVLQDAFGTCIGISDDGSLVAVYKPSEGVISIYNMIQKKLLKNIKSNFNITTIEFSSDNKKIIATGPAAPIIFHELSSDDLETQELAFSKDYLNRELAHILFANASFDNDKNHILALCLERSEKELPYLLTKLVRWNIKTDKLEQQPIPDTVPFQINKPITAFNIESNTIAFVSRDALTLYNATSKISSFFTFSAKKRNLISCLALNSDASVVAIGYEDGQIELYSTTTKNLITHFEKLESKVNFIEFAQNNTLLAVSNKKMYLYDTSFAYLFLRNQKPSLEQIVVILIYKLLLDKKKEAIFSNNSYLSTVFFSLPNELIDALSELH